MPGFVLTQGATVLCAHGGQAQPTAPSPRVTVSGQPLVTAQAPYAVAGCGFVPPSGNGPCVTATFLPPTASLRVTSSGAPLLVQSSQATCVPTGTPLVIAVTQARVRAA